MQNNTLFSKNLQRVFDMFEIRDSATKAFMLAAFEAGVKDAHGESNQVPALFKSTADENFDWSEIQFAEEEEENEFDDCTWLSVGMQASAVSLTQQDAATLRAELSELAYLLQSQRKYFKDWEQTYYKYSDPDTESGQYNFKHLNKIRNDIRKNKQREAKINALIRKLKGV